MKKPIRIAHIIDVMDSGGIESVVMNYYRNIDRTKFQFDFITSSVSTLPQRKEIEKLGGKIYLIPRFTSLFSYNKELKKIFKENKYSIVHCHMGALSLFPLSVAKKCGIKTRICHAHSTSNKKEWKRNLIKNILKVFVKLYPTNYFACGEYAGRWLYGNKTFDKSLVHIIPNAIDCQLFKYNDKTRTDIRKELNISDKFVIGHIGRFVSQKNHSFLIDIFNEVSKTKKNAILLLIGEGPLEPLIKEKVEELNLEDKVLFLGVRKDCYKLYQAMDVFVLPSLYEGLPVVGVEAQCAGLPCIFSATTTKEILVTKNTCLMQLDKAAWCNKILQLKKIKDREVENYPFDIKVAAKQLTEKYDCMIKGDL